MKTKLPQNILKRIVIICLFSIFFFTNCNKEELFYENDEIVKAKAWYEKNHDSQIEANPFYSETLKWNNASFINQNVFIPINMDNKTIAIKTEENEQKIDFSYYPYITLTKTGQNTYVESLKLYFSPITPTLETNQMSIIEFNTDNSSNILKNKKELNQSLNKGCVITNWWLVTTWSDGSTTEEYVGSSANCNNNEEGLDHTPGGGGGTTTGNNNFLDQNVWDDQTPYDDWNRLTECERSFFKSNPHHLYTAQTNRKAAENVAMKRFKNCNNPNGTALHNTIGDAYRHAYFSALNTHNMGLSNAKKLGDAHECDTPSDKLNEKEMDLNNNDFGYLYGTTYSYINESQFYNAFMEAFKNKQIKIIQACQ